MEIQDQESQLTPDPVFNDFLIILKISMINLKIQVNTIHF